MAAVAKRPASRHAASAEHRPDSRELRKRGLTAAQIQKVQTTEAKLSLLDNRFKMFVRMTDVEELAISALDLTIPVSPDTTVDELKDLITVMSRQPVDFTNTKLIYCGRVMEPGSKLSDYPYEKEALMWAKPYVGVLWIAPNFIRPGFSKSRVHAVNRGDDLA